MAYTVHEFTVRYGGPGDLATLEVWADPEESDRIQFDLSGADQFSGCGIGIDLDDAVKFVDMFDRRTDHGAPAYADCDESDAWLTTSWDPTGVDLTLTFEGDHPIGLYGKAIRVEVNGNDEAARLGTAIRACIDILANS